MELLLGGFTPTTPPASGSPLGSKIDSRISLTPFLEIAEGARMKYTLDSPFPFGKHKGKSLKYLLENEQQYLCWLKRQSWFKGPFRSLLENEGILCILCGDNTQGMYAGEDIYIKCPSCGGGQ